MERKSREERSRSERELFNSIASTFVKKDIYPPSKLAKKHRVKQTVSGIDFSSGPDILDIGCGAGFNSEYLKGAYSRYTGVDFSEELVALAGSIHKGPGIEFLVTDLYRYSPGKQYDLILIISVLHHMVDIPLALKAARGLLKPGGMIVVNEPQDSNLFARFFRWLRGKFDKSYSSDQEQLNRKELAGQFAKAGFTNITIRPQGIFSTPFAQFMWRPVFIFLPVSFILCRIDWFIEKVFGRVFKGLSWNIIVTGRNTVK